MLSHFENSTELLYYVQCKFLKSPELGKYSKLWEQGTAPKCNLYISILVFYLGSQITGLLQWLPSLPGQRRTVVLTRRLPCVTPWQSGTCPLVTPDTLFRHYHCCSSETCSTCSVAALEITVNVQKAKCC